ncbi:MAG: metal ABC transporter substrate-binding protein [Phycisphaerae bacterium]|nr:metal ABC transporter substrate-binding protein [Phycisphaerae bacterium]
MRNCQFVSLLLIASLSLAMCASCSNDAKPPSAAPQVSATATPASNVGTLRIIAVNTPLACFTKRIAGDRAAVTMPVPSGDDPAFWSPGADDVVAMQSADLVILNSAGHEPWRTRSALAHGNVVATAERFKPQWIEVADGVTHSHGLQGSHSHKGTAFTTWIDPTLAIEQAQAILEALKKLRPNDAAAFDENFTKLKTDLADIDARLASAIHGQQSLPIVVSHPIYDYLIRRFALNAVAVHWEPGEMPPAEEWETLAELLKTHPAKWMVWEDAPLSASRDKLRALGVESVVFRPAGNLPGDPLAWIEVQRENAAELGKVFE